MGGAKVRWGTVISLVSVAMVGAAFAVFIRYPSNQYPSLYGNTLPILGLILSVVSLLAGHFSYPRVHNLKVYCAGYLVGLVGLSYVLLATRPSYQDDFVTALMLASFANVLLVLGLKSYEKYRTARAITLTAVSLETCALVCLRYAPEALDWAPALARTDIAGVPTWIAAGWAIAVGVLSAFRTRSEFHLGGVIAGLGFIYLVWWLSPVLVTDSRDFERLLAVTAPFYLNVGILVHWLARMEHRISYDPLLHIYNRNYCSTVISEQSNLNTSPPFGVAMVDIDHFKKVNDTYGHQAGDQVLYAVAQTILREVVPDGIACRYGGEEIVVFFPRMDAKEVMPIMEDVRAAVEALKVPTRRKKLSVTISCGVSHRGENSQSVIDVIHAADKALYRAKKGGRNQTKSGKAGKKASKKK